MGFYKSKAFKDYLKEFYLHAFHFEGRVEDAAILFSRESGRSRRLRTRKLEMKRRKRLSRIESTHRERTPKGGESTTDDEVVFIDNEDCQSESVVRSDGDYVMRDGCSVDDHEGDDDDFDDFFGEENEESRRGVGPVGGSSHDDEGDMDEDDYDSDLTDIEDEGGNGCGGPSGVGSTSSTSAPRADPHHDKKTCVYAVDMNTYIENVFNTMDLARPAKGDYMMKIIFGQIVDFLPFIDILIVAMDGPRCERPPPKRLDIKRSKKIAPYAAPLTGKVTNNNFPTKEQWDYYKSSSEFRSRVYNYLTVRIMRFFDRYKSDEGRAIEVIINCAVVMYDDFTESRESVVDYFKRCGVEEGDFCELRFNIHSDDAKSVKKLRRRAPDDWRAYERGLVSACEGEAIIFQYLSSLIAKSDNEVHALVNSSDTDIYAYAWILESTMGSNGHLYLVTRHHKTLGADKVPIFKTKKFMVVKFNTMVKAMRRRLVRIFSENPVKRGRRGSSKASAPKKLAPDDINFPMVVLCYTMLFGCDFVPQIGHLHGMTSADKREFLVPGESAAPASPRSGRGSRGATVSEAASDAVYQKLIRFFYSIRKKYLIDRDLIPWMIQNGRKLVEFVPQRAQKGIKIDRAGLFAFLMRNNAKKKKGAGGWISAEHQKKIKASIKNLEWTLNMFLRPGDPRAIQNCYDVDRRSGRSVWGYKKVLDGRGQARCYQSME